MYTATAKPQIASVRANWKTSCYEITYYDKYEIYRSLNVDFQELESLMDSEVTGRYMETDDSYSETGDDNKMVLDRDALIQYHNEYVKGIALQFINSKN